MKVFNVICRKINCWHPSNPQFYAIVHPRIQTTLRSILNKLDRDGSIIIYRLPFKAGKAVHWPPFTLAWSSETWNGLCDVPNAQAKEEERTLRMALAAVVEGGKVPEQVLAAAGTRQNLPLLSSRITARMTGDITTVPVINTNATAAEPTSLQQPLGNTALAAAPLLGQTSLQQPLPNTTPVAPLATYTFALQDDLTEVTTASSNARLAAIMERVEAGLAAINNNSANSTTTTTRNMRWGDSLSPFDSVSQASDSSSTSTRTQNGRWLRDCKKKGRENETRKEKND